MVFLVLSLLQTQNTTSPLPQGERMMPSVSLAKPALILEGSNKVYDFRGVRMRGSTAATLPNLRRGLAIEVRGDNVTLIEPKIHGYAVAILARNCKGLKIVRADLSYNYRPRLLSTPEREDGADWMFYHKNENDEWLKGRPKEGIPPYYGAIYLSGCSDFEVNGCRVTGGQNALMMTRCNNGRVWNNDFSFNSGLGIGMYRSSNNRIMHNRLDFNVRGYSHGVYNRGQDSAAILIYEQSNKNVFAYNSATHSGDGFFLWAGQTTMDTGKGGCNDNLIYGNDFSHAPTNGIEATFSRNVFAHNLVMECWHGVWGGYSYDSKFVGNGFAYNQEGFAIEHGQNNVIADNILTRNGIGVRLWQNATQDPNWGYPKSRDTASHDVDLTGNIFEQPKGVALNVRDTLRVRLDRNEIVAPGEPFQRAGNTEGWTLSDNLLLKGDTSTNPALAKWFAGRGLYADESKMTAAELREAFATSWNGLAPAAKPSVRALAPKTMTGGIDPFDFPPEHRGRRYIVIDEWGPYDFRRPLLKLDRLNAGTANFELWGPKGTARLKLASGLEVAAKTFKVPGRFSAKLLDSSRMKLDMVYTGEATVDAVGVVTPAGKPVPLNFALFRWPITWKVNFYRWDEKSDPRTQAEAFGAVLKGKPIRTETKPRLDYAGGRFWAGGPNDHFATIAEGTSTLEPGTYDLDIVSDDGIRVYVDDKLVIADGWKYQAPTRYKATLKLGGTHRFRVEHFQIDGYAQLSVTLKPRP